MKVAGVSQRLRLGSISGCLWLLAALFTAHFAMAQTAGEGTIQGTVKDGTGALIAGATVTATNTANNVSTTRTSSSDGLYTIAPLPPGNYTVTVVAKGFKTYKQENLDVVGLGVLDFSPALAIGTESDTVTVEAAPPVLDTDSAILGTVMENETYSNLPILQSTSQARDPTAFATLSPGSQAGSRTPLIGGTANYSGYLYLDGLPVETINQQGDNRPVALNVSIEAVDQFQVLTSVPPAEYMGAGSTNYTIKSGGLKFHGQVSGFFRNTIFEAWSFTGKASTIKNSAGVTVQAPKPIEHPSELSASIGGFVPHAKHKVFFFVAYDRYHSRVADTPSLLTLPSTLMENGDFTEISNGGTFITGGQNGTGATNPAVLFDPTTNNCVGTTCTRQPFQAMKNGVLTNNVIPTADISSITQKMESFLPNYNNPTAANYNNSVFANNYLGTQVGGKDSHLYDYRVDIDLTSRNRVSAVGGFGQYAYLNNFGSPYLPLPYAVGDYATIVPKVFDVEDAYTITDHLTNQFKFGYTRFYMPIINATQGVAAYDIGTFGVTYLPAGQGRQEFPGVNFGTPGKSLGSTAPTTWTTDGNAASTQLTIPNNYAIVDNLQWVKGRHVITAGYTFQFEGLNNANPATYTGVVPLQFDQYATANFTAGKNTIDTTNTGFGYASFLLGAVGATSSGTAGLTLPLQNVATIYSRIKAQAPFVEDSYKVTKRLIVDYGLRWDYLPPLHEKFNHFTFLNPTAINSATGYAGALEFDGSYGGAAVSCGCKTPVTTYWKDFGPRVGVVFSVDDKTVFRVAGAIVYSQGGGTGGGRVTGGPGASGGAGQALGFNTNAVAPGDTLTGATAGPSFWLNSNAAYLGANANTSLFGPGYTYPSAPAYGAASTILSAGNYLTAAGAFVTPSSMGYDDPYASGRAPMYTFYNAGLERSITRDMTLQVNYVGNESHHAWDGGATNARGYWNNQLNPVYLVALGGVNGKSSSGATVPLLTAPATSANVAILNANLPGQPNPASFIAAANAFPNQSTVTIAQMLVAFPQYSSVQDGWGGSFEDNFSYNSLQVTLSQRTSHGLTFNVNYTYSKNIGDDGTFRSGFPIPAGAIDGGGKSWKADRIDRSWTTVSIPEIVNAYGVYKLPFGRKGQLGGNNLVTRGLLGGWQLSGVYTYSSGTPVVVTWSSGGNCANAAPNAGQCMPSLNPAFLGQNARKNGSYGSGPNGFNACNIGVGSGCTAISYVNVNAFQAPGDLSTVAGTHQYLIGNAPRTAAYSLRNPGTENVNASLRRSIPLPHETAFVFEADCTNVWNKVTFGGPSGGWGAGSATFGQVTSASGSPRDWQFAGHITF